MRKRKVAKMALCTSGLLLVMALFLYLYAVMCHSGTEFLIVQEEQGELGEDAEDEVTAVCEMVRAMDFTVEQPHMELTDEEDRAYREAFLRLLKNALPIEGWNEGEDCYQNLWWAGRPYEELLENRDSVGFPYAYYYDDIDGDGKPEFVVNQGAVYVFDYELGEEACSISYRGLSQYFRGVLGVGKMWEQDYLHAWVERFRYIVLNDDGKWETVLDLELCYDEDEDEGIYVKYYDINYVGVEKEIYEELTAPFFEAIEYEIPTMTLTEVFGELLEE
ncbi:MAG: hypothetical protein NC417_10105 [Candidatus Gastranaerophilales bacterium]|nr:hypothetical protein [Candidatus Gastranaerophilales bacterium]